ncbi:MAG: hypothetical protein K2N94_05035, partial [Lachnospiraceae bacterium]|nr:hypothetical protein [Lachnospiraceae bacterium]
PFIVWLLENAVPLSQYFQRQWKQIIDCLCEKNAEAIIETWDTIRGQLLSLTNHYGVNVSALPQLTRDDFWSEKDLK